MLRTIDTKKTFLWLKLYAPDKPILLLFQLRLASVVKAF